MSTSDISWPVQNVSKFRAFRIFRLVLHDFECSGVPRPVKVSFVLFVGSKTYYMLWPLSQMVDTKSKPCGRR